MLGYLSYTSGSSATTDIFLRAEDDALATELLDALGIDPATVDEWQLGGRPLSNASRLRDLVIDGSSLGRRGSDGATTKTGGSAGVVLQIAAGPDAGRAWHLSPGTYVVGRAADCDVVLASDPLSSRHHARLKVADTHVVVTDLDSANGVLTRGILVDECEVARGEPFQLGETVMTISQPVGTDAVVAGDGTGGLAFSRPPRLRRNEPPSSVTFPVPPSEHGKIPFPLMASLAPVVIGVVLAIVMKRPEYLLFTILSPVIAVSSHLSTKRQGKRSYRRRVAEFERAQASAREQLAAAIAAEETAVRVAFPDPPTVGSVAMTPGHRLWERRSGDSDFLILRTGITDCPTSVEVKGLPDRYDDEDATHGQEPSALLRQVPTTFSLEDSGVLGVAGANEQSRALARWFVAQIATWHAPDDVSLVVCGTETDPDCWAWARWLPHVRGERDRRVADVSVSDDVTSQLCMQVAGVVDGRLMARQTSGSADTQEKPVVMVIDGAYRIGASAALTKILRYGPSVGVYSICVEDAERFLPEECKAAAVFDPDQPTRLTAKRAGENDVDGVLADLVSVEWAENVARALAPLHLTRGREVAAGIPTSVRLLDEVELDPPDPVKIAKIWGGGGRTTEAIIGCTARSQLVLDLSRSGPHGLVAGTTGSGKSELLQTIIASLAIANRPDAMTFVLIDYKGGSAFKQCAKLPHTVGVVTDLDGHLTERALVSLGAELRRREQILLSAGAKDIDELVRQCQRAGTNPPLARLVLVIDEFASLVDELPEFVDGLVDVARRGRSLGIHLILATQRPAGVVSAPIKANTNFRIAMRVTDAADSIDVIDSNAAARIPKEIPGRAFIRVGHDQLTEFQAARVGGFRQQSLRPLRVEAYGVPIDQLTRDLRQPVVVASDADDTDLSAVADAMITAMETSDVEVARSPWLEPLPDIYVLNETEALEDKFALVLGLEDFPEEQRQAPAVWDIERSGHLLICGDAGSGRSTALRAIGAAIGRQTGPADVHLFGLDCGNGMLAPLSGLPHCGAVASRVETQRVDRLLERLREEVALRQHGLARGGFASIADQRAGVAEEERWPYIVLLVDRWEGFTATFDALDNGRLVQELLHLMREGVGAGLRVVLAGDRSVLSGRIVSLADQTLVLSLNDRAGYGSAGLNPRNVPDHLPPGRALRAYGRTELQVGILDEDTSGPAQVRALEKLGTSARKRWGSVAETRLAQPIGSLPSHVGIAAAKLPGPISDDSPLVIGVGGDRVSPRAIGLGVESSGFVVAGPPRSGRSNLLLAIASQAMERKTQVAVITSRPSPLQGLAGQRGVVGIYGPESPVADIEAAMQVEDRLFVIVDDAELVANQGVSDLLIAFHRRARDSANCLIVAGTSSDLASGFRGFVSEVRKGGNGVILCAGSPADGDVLGVRLSKTMLSSGPVGRGVLAWRGGLLAIQTPLAEPEEFQR